MLILGIESSCDETAAAVVQDGTHILSDVVVSQIDVHRDYGGVVPELASRKHIEAISLVIEQALERAGVNAADLDGIGVTRGPGLIGSLLVGIGAAKGMALALGLPLCGVNHLHGHLFASFLERNDLQFPFVGLVVSGGHTSLFHVTGPLEIQLIGKTRDDAAGEAFDKVAKLLGLGYPGGVVIERYAKGWDSGTLRFPRALMDGESLDFSFSGLKTAVLRHVEEQFNVTRRSDIPAVSIRLFRKTSPGKWPIPSGTVAAAFQDAVTEVLVVKGLWAARRYNAERLVVCGGVAANGGLREKMDGEGRRAGIEPIFPSPRLCTDNGAMIAARTESLIRAGLTDDLSFGAKSRW